MDLAGETRLGYSRLKLFGFLIVGLAFGLVCVTAALGWWAPRLQPGSLKEFLVGYVGTAFTVIMELFILRKMVLAKSETITLSPEGLRDIRIAEDLIPWAAITRMGLWTMKRQKMLMIEVDPQVEAGLNLTKAARLMRPFNMQTCGMPYCVNHAGLTMEADFFFDEMFCRWRNAQPSNEESPLTPKPAPLP